MSILRLMATKRLSAIARLQNFRFPFSSAGARLWVCGADDSVLPVEHGNLWPMCLYFFGGQASRKPAVLLFAQCQRRR